ncbi:MAG: class I SAM-dependent methyltransferase [Acidimicrobiia bacterium]
MVAADAVTNCRSCGSDRLKQIVDLGLTPIANALVDAENAPESDAVYPLNVVFCEACALVQLGAALPAGAMFDTDYPYFSSFSPAFVEHARAYAAAMTDRLALSSEDLVVEIASNDGYLLKNFVANGVRALGVDPSPGPARAAEEIGVPTIVDFFGRNVAAKIVESYGPARLVAANNVMAHVPDLDDFVGGFAILLADDGLLTVENPYVRDLVDHVEFDTIYHEHYCYYSCSSVDALMQRHGLHLNDVEYFPDLHGGTLRWFIGKHPARTARCDEYLAREERDGLRTFAFYQGLSTAVSACQESLRTMLTALRAEGRRVVAYGAAAKGATLLNSTGIGTDLLDYVVDRNPHKQGKLMPGCRLPIRPVEVLLDDRPDDVVLLSWNFAEEIARQQQAYVEQGGRFIVPVPTAHVLGS